MLDSRSDESIEPDAAYEAPAITRLGTLAELTLGGDTATNDAMGGAGDTGSV